MHSITQNSHICRTTQKAEKNGFPFRLHSYVCPNTFILTLYRRKLNANEPFTFSSTVFFSFSNRPYLFVYRQNAKRKGEMVPKSGTILRRRVACKLETNIQKGETPMILRVAYRIRSFSLCQRFTHPPTTINHWTNTQPSQQQRCAEDVLWQSRTCTRTWIENAEKMCCGRRMTCHQNVGTFTEMLVIIQININRDQNENGREQTWNREVCCCANNIKIKHEERRAAHDTHKYHTPSNASNFFPFFTITFLGFSFICVVPRGLYKNYQRVYRYFAWVKNCRLFHLPNINDQQRKIPIFFYIFFSGRAALKLLPKYELKEENAGD